MKAQAAKVTPLMTTREAEGCERVGLLATEELRQRFDGGSSQLAVLPTASLVRETPEHGGSRRQMPGS